MLDLGQWKKAQKALEQSIEIRRRLGDQKGELSAVNSLANLFRRNADTLDSAIEMFQTALQSSLAVGVSKVILLNGLGLTLYEKGELQQASDYFQEVLQLAQKMNDDVLRASALHNLGSVKWTRGNLYEAQELLEQAQKIQQTAQDNHGLAETLNSLGLVLEGLGQWDEAIASYQNALEQMQTVSDFFGQSQILVNLGNVYSLRNQPVLAISCHEQAYEIAKELGNPRLQGQALSALGDANRLAGELDKAENQLLSAIDIKNKAGEVRSLKHTWQSLAAVYHQQKRPVEAESGYKKGLEIARGSHDKRMESVILLNLSTLFTPPGKIPRSKDFF